MRAFIIRQAEAIAPVGQKPDALFFGDAQLSGYREKSLAALGFKSPQWVEAGDPLEGPALIMGDDVFISRRALRRFLKEARSAGGLRRFVLPPSRLLTLTLPLQDLPARANGHGAFDVFFLPAGQRMSVEEVLAADEDADLECGFKEISVDMPLPRHIFGQAEKSFSFPLTSHVAIRLRHWVHLLRLGNFMPQVLLLDKATSQPLRSLWRAMWAVDPRAAHRWEKLKAAFVYKGRDVVIHPTATVEASILGDGVRIGAYAYVVGSVLGEGVVVEERANINYSALGPATFVSKNSTVVATTSLGDADVCVNGMQYALVSPRAALTSWARPLDWSAAGPIKVQDGDRLREVGELPCGVAFGPGVFLGAGVTVAPGRAIPGGWRLVGDPNAVLSSGLDIEKGPHSLAVVKQGKLSPVDAKKDDG